MPIDLTTLIETDALGRVPAHVAVDQLVARPGFAPLEWQSAAPAEAHETNKLPVQDSLDLRRIIALPRREQVGDGGPLARALVEWANARFGRRRQGPCECERISIEHYGDSKPCLTSLNLAQSWALAEIETCAGLLGPIGVGHGKTILDILAALAMPDCQQAVLLVPVGLLVQLVAEYEMLDQHFVVPSLVVHGEIRLPRDPVKKPYNALRSLPGNKPAPTLHAYPYSKLSRPDSTAKLEELAPDTIISDECHKLRHVDTATTARVMRYFNAHQKTRFCGWSGSLTDSSLRDYAHLAYLALRNNSPLPTEPDVVEDWCRALDPRVAGEDPSNPWSTCAPAGALVDLCQPGEHYTIAFHRRLVETQGVVATTSSAVSSALSIEERHIHYSRVPMNVSNALDDLRETWVRPDGEQLVDALSVARCARELACGFYYQWWYPRGESIKLILEWLEIRKLFRAELRWALARRVEHMDSPYLCEQAAMRATGELPIPPCPHDVDRKEWKRRHPIWESIHWPDWRAIRNQVQPETRPVRLSNYLAVDAAEWGQQNRGIIWYDSAEFGRMVEEESQLERYGGGPDAATKIAKVQGGRSIICSIKSHGTGRDGLQRHFWEQLVAQPPPSATGWEQMLGRLHRIGQKNPVVRTLFYRHTDELAHHVDQALARALYVQTTIGASQKLRAGFNIPDRVAPEDWVDPLGLLGDADSENEQDEE